MTALPVWRVSIGRASEPSQESLPRRRGEDDDMLAVMYIRMWSLATGRRLPPGVKSDQLTADELVAFLADDFSTASGRHAAPDAGPAGEGR